MKRKIFILLTFFKTLLFQTLESDNCFPNEMHFCIGEEYNHILFFPKKINSVSLNMIFSTKVKYIFSYNLKIKLSK